VPHQVVAAVPADVVKGLHLTGVVTAHDDRGVHHLELFGEVTALARKLFDSADIQPGPLEHRLSFDLELLGADGVLVGHRIGAQPWIVFGPTALGRLGEPGHGALLIDVTTQPTVSARCTNDK